MSIATKIKGLFQSKQKRELSAEKAYDLWAESYDAQPDNLMLQLDTVMVNEFLNTVNCKNKNVLDIGCGTGRYWETLRSHSPNSLTGYDVSAGMIQKLKIMYPSCNAHIMDGTTLAESADDSIDIIFSTLTLAHLPDLFAAMKDWNRVLKKNGELIITDFHPKMLAGGGQRTFSHEGTTIVITNYIHEIDSLKNCFQQLGWDLITFKEVILDETLKPFYEKQNAMQVYHKFQGMPIIFGVHLIKRNAVS